MVILDDMSIFKYLNSIRCTFPRWNDKGLSSHGMLLPFVQLSVSGGQQGQEGRGLCHFWWSIICSLSLDWFGHVYLLVDISVTRLVCSLRSDKALPAEQGRGGCRRQEWLECSVGGRTPLCSNPFKSRSVQNTRGYWKTMYFATPCLFVAACQPLVFSLLMCIINIAANASLFCLYLVAIHKGRPFRRSEVTIFDDNFCLQSSLAMLWGQRHPWDPESSIAQKSAQEHRTRIVALVPCPWRHHFLQILAISFVKNGMFWSWIQGLSVIGWFYVIRSPLLCRHSDLVIDLRRLDVKFLKLRFRINEGWPGLFLLWSKMGWFPICHVKQSLLFSFLWNWTQTPQIPWDILFISISQPKEKAV